MSNWKLDDVTIVRNFNEDGYSKMPIDEYVQRLSIELDMVKSARDRGETHVWERVTKNKNNKVIVLTSFSEPERRGSGGVDTQTIANIAAVMKAGITDPAQIAQVLAAAQQGSQGVAPDAPAEEKNKAEQDKAAQALSALGF